MDEKQFEQKNAGEALETLGALEIVWKEDGISGGHELFKCNDGEISFILPRFKSRLSYVYAIKNNGEPRFFDPGLEKSPHPILYIAPFISKSFGSFLEGKNISFLDYEGNALLLGKKLYFSQRKTDRNTLITRKDTSAFSFKAEKSSLILRTLLNEPFRFFTVRDLAKDSEASLGQVSNVHSFLTRGGWIEKSPHGFRIHDSVSLLKAWAPIYQKTKNEGRKASFFTTYKRGDLMKVLSQIKGWYLASYSAAERYHPMVLNPVTFLYVDRLSFEEVMKILPASPVQSGPNLLIQEASLSELSYSQISGGISLVSPVEVILSLEGTGGRSEEALTPFYEDFTHDKERSRTPDDRGL